MKGLSWWRLGLWAVLTGLPLLPHAAMQESDEIDWTATEFALAGVLLVALGALYEIAKPSITKEIYRVAAAGALVALVVTIWAHGAVNVF